MNTERFGKRKKGGCFSSRKGYLSAKSAQIFSEFLGPDISDKTMNRNFKAHTSNHNLVGLFPTSVSWEVFVNFFIPAIH